MGVPRLQFHAVECTLGCRERGLVGEVRQAPGAREAGQTAGRAELREVQARQRASAGERRRHRSRRRRLLHIISDKIGWWPVSSG